MDSLSKIDVLRRPGRRVWVSSVDLPWNEDETYADAPASMVLALWSPSIWFLEYPDMSENVCSIDLGFVQGGKIVGRVLHRWFGRSVYILPRHVSCVIDRKRHHAFDTRDHRGVISSEIPQ